MSNKVSDCLCSTCPSFGSCSFLTTGKPCGVKRAPERKIDGNYHTPCGKTFRIADQPEYLDHLRTCIKCQEIQTQKHQVKPTPAPSRLLSDVQIGDIFLSHNIKQYGMEAAQELWKQLPDLNYSKAIAKVQDAKTSALVRAECQGEIKELTRKGEELCCYYGNSLIELHDKDREIALLKVLHKKELERIKDVEIKQRDANYAQLQKWADCQLAEAKKQGAKELIEAEGASLSVLSYQWAADATAWADKRRGKIVFISEAKIKEIGL